MFSSVKVGPVVARKLAVLALITGGALGSIITILALVESVSPSSSVTITWKVRVAVA